jgi:hypothetical protein
MYKRRDPQRAPVRIIARLCMCLHRSNILQILKIFELKSRKNMLLQEEAYKVTIQNVGCSPQWPSDEWDPARIQIISLASPHRPFHNPSIINRPVLSPLSF